jgi:hypothetical protein
MAIKLPNLSGAGAHRLIACARIKKSDKSVQQLLKERRSLIFPYTASGRNFFGRLITGGFVGHFHVECATPEYFPAGMKPKPNATLKEFEAIAEPVMGCDAGIRIKCFFEVPLAALSKTGVIQTLSAETIAAGVSVKLTAGTLTLSGSPIHRVEWRLENDERIRIGLDSLRTQQITQDYLNELLAWSRSLFDVIILSKEAKSNA